LQQKYHRGEARHKVLALVFLLVAEFTLVVLRGMSIRHYLATRDPVSGTVYYVMLGVFAVVARR